MFEEEEACYARGSSSIMAHQEPSSWITYKWTYDVFLSFYGDDTRLGFTSHLYQALRQRGIRVFLDDECIRTGENITPTLFKAIEESRIAIIVFSGNYANSTFCLRELEKIIECFKEESRLIYPVFYHVDPSELRNPRESYAKALAQLENRFKDERHKVEKWRLALSQAADLKGCHLKPNQLKHIEGMPPNLEAFSAICCSSLTKLSKSKVLKQAFNFQPGKRNFILPGKQFPEGLHHYSRGSSVSFWVRNVLPTTFLWILVKDDHDYVYNCQVSVHINDTKLNIASKWIVRSTIKTDHIYICDMQSIILNTELPLRNKWNQVKVSLESNAQKKEDGKEVYFGIHLHNLQSNSENIRFMDPRRYSMDHILLRNIHEQDCEELEEYMDLDSNPKHYQAFDPSSEPGAEEDFGKNTVVDGHKRARREEEAEKSKKGKKGEKKEKEPRFAFITKSEVDLLEDGYRWRKYGKESVKTSPYPRTYYRCTTQKCTAKKRVERSFEDPTTVITTYQGQHNHPVPTSLRGNYNSAAMFTPSSSSSSSTSSFSSFLSSF